MAFLTKDDLLKLGFAHLGENVLISDKASFYGCDRISIGNNVRIDDFCTLSAGEGGIDIGNYIHIAVYSLLIGAGRISLADYSNISSRVSIYSSNDDYSGRYMTNPMVPDHLTNVDKADVEIGKHVVIGSGTVVLPGVYIHDGAAIGALSLVNCNCDGFFIYAGSPIRKIKERHRDLLDKEDDLLMQNHAQH